MGRVDGKVVFLTGAGSGIGRAGAQLFAREGAKVAVADISREGGAETVRLIKAAGGEALYVETDVTQPTSVEQAIRETGRYGKLHVLYNNAGGSTINDGPVTEVSLNEWHRTINVDLYGTFLCCKYGIPELIKAGGGAVINTPPTSLWRERLGEMPIRRLREEYWHSPAHWLWSMPNMAFA